jgi:hypothetical protein
MQDCNAAIVLADLDATNSMSPINTCSRTAMGELNSH